MSLLTGKGVAMVGLAGVVPENREDNQNLDTLTEKSRSEIVKQVGIRYRHVAQDGLTASDLCEKAAEELIQKLGWELTDIGILVFVTQTPDHLVPGSATQIQHRLGLSSETISIDVNQGCAGYVYGISVITAMMRAYQIPKALLLVGDTITKMISKEDNSLRPIFADAGTATAFELDSEAAEMNYELGSNGSDYEAIYIPEGGYRFPVSADSLALKNLDEGVQRAGNQLSMNGQAVFTFGLSTVASSITEMLENRKITPSEIDYLVLHQANQLLNNSITRKVGFRSDQAPSSLYDFGNTSCATIPITLVSQLETELGSKKLKLMLTGFGVGLSWGSLILQTNKVVCLPIMYI